jgi:hypothetical protein
MENSNGIKYYLSKETYMSDFAPAYKQFALDLKSVFQTSIVLPFQFPVKNNTAISIPVSDRKIFTAIFRDAEELLQIKFPLKYKNYDTIKTKITVVEMNLLFENAVHEYSNIETSSNFDLVMDSLNIILSSYRVLYGDEKIYRLMTEMITIPCDFRYSNINDWDVGTIKGIFTYNPKKEAEILDNTKIERFLEYIPVFRNRNNPYPILEEYLIDARRFMLSGMFDWCIISAQTHIEGLLRTIYRQIKLNNVSNIVELEKKLEEVSFSDLIKKEMPSILGGNWNLDNDKNTVGIWYQKCYQIRNRIVHAGYRPSNIEAEAAYIGAQDMRLFVYNRLKSKSKYHPIFAGLLKL